MKTLKTLIFLMSLISIPQINAQKLTLDASKSTLEWTGKAAFNAYSLTGTLEALEGEITIENGHIINLQITINMKSLDHDNSDLKKHLRGKDFFEVKKYSQATFKLTRPSKIENNMMVLIGNMTIKDTTKEETISVTLNNNTLVFNHVMDRTGYGVKFNSPSFFKKMKENAIADDFTLQGRLVFE